MRKEEPQIAGLFNQIAPRYDLLNRLLSFRMDVLWRKKVADALPAGEGLSVLDLATGTGDLALTLVSRCARIQQVLGLDVAQNMLDIGRKKVLQLGYSSKINLQKASAMEIPCDNCSFDAVTMAFGIRNVEDPAQVLREIHRVLKPGGLALVLEFSMPSLWIIKSVYLFYFRHILPRVGALLSGDLKAYRYLNQSVEDFPSGEAFLDLLRRSGFVATRANRLTFGVATIYVGEKDLARP